MNNQNKENIEQNSSNKIIEDNQPLENQEIINYKIAFTQKINFLLKAIQDLS